MKIAIPQFWKKASPLEKRVYSTIAMFLLAVLLIIAGSFTPLSSQNANELNDYRNQQIQNIYTDFGSSITSLFLNNFPISLIMFIPVVGPIWGLSQSVTVGVVFAGYAAANSVPVVLVIISVLLSPVLWLEFFAYAIAMTESVWFLRRLLQGQWRRELKILAITIGICAILLLIGAIVEAWPYFFQ